MNKVILDIGCASGDLHQKLAFVSETIYGIDRDECSYPNTFQIDLDDYNQLDSLPDLNVDVIILGEVLEHLANPGNFLDALRKYKAEVVITVPNAFCKFGMESIVNDRVECVNRDHVAYYTWMTLQTLIRRYKYWVKELYWYGGLPMISEGLIMVCEVD